MNFKYRLLQLASKPSPNRRRLYHPVLALSFGVCLVLGNTVHANQASNRQQAIEVALQQNGGNAKVLGVQTQQTQDGQMLFEVKLLSNGRIRVYRIKKVD